MLQRSSATCVFVLFVSVVQGFPLVVSTRSSPGDVAVWLLGPCWVEGLDGVQDTDARPVA